jgi:hypothetical protein
MHVVFGVTLRLELPAFLSTAITTSFSFSCFPSLQLGHPPQTDISAYTSIFLPNKSAVNTLKSFTANAKRSSPRQYLGTSDLASPSHFQYHTGQTAESTKTTH